MLSMSCYRTKNPALMLPTTTTETITNLTGLRSLINKSVTILTLPKNKLIVVLSKNNLNPIAHLLHMSYTVILSLMSKQHSRTKSLSLMSLAIREYCKLLF